jgi:flagellar motor protein MotB
MKRLLILFTALALSAPPTFADDQPTAPAQGAASSDTKADAPMSETIKGEVKEQLDIQKPPPSIELDSKDFVESGTAQTENVLQEAKPVPSKEDFDNYAKLTSNQVLRPWLPLIPEPPLVTFYPGLTKVVSKHWEFRVSDDSGEVIKTIKGKGVPPRQIEWNGLDERGQYITVGTLYSYQFITYDENENAHTFPGEPFQLDALMYTQKGKLVVEFSNKRLFDQDSAKIRAAMQGLWDRAIDVVRENSNKPLLVEVYAESVKSPLAEQRRQAAVTSISDATNVPEVEIKHAVEEIGDRGDVTRLVMNSR